jgi:hypothetical protein
MLVVLHTTASAEHNGSGQFPMDETLDKSTDMPFLVYSFIFSNREPRGICGSPLWFKLPAHQSIMNGIIWLTESKELSTFRPRSSYISQDAGSRISELLCGYFVMTVWIGISPSQFLWFKTTEKQKRHRNIRICHADSDPLFQCQWQKIVHVCDRAVIIRTI